MTTQCCGDERARSLFASPRKPEGRPGLHTCIHPNFQTAKHHRPCSYVGAGYALFLLPPLKARGWRSANRRIRTKKRASWRPTAAFSLRRRAALFGAGRGSPLALARRGGRRRLSSASSSQGLVVVPGGAPTPPGCEFARLTRGRRIGRDRELPGAGHRDRHRISGAYPRSVPPSRRLMTAPLRRTGRGQYGYLPKDCQGLFSGSARVRGLRDGTAAVQGPSNTARRCSGRTSGGRAP
jgi:hypothetical protein